MLTENFNAPFPAWESGSFGVNSNAVNALCGTRGCADRGNNSDGLYVAGPGQTGAINVTFNSGFASTITIFALDVAAALDTTLLAFDINGTEIFRRAVVASNGIPTTGDYVRYSITSSNGISRFAFTDDSATSDFSGPPAGSTLIDNLRLTTRDAVTPPPAVVPEPGILALLGVGFMGFMAARRKS